MSARRNSLKAPKDSSGLERFVFGMVVKLGSPAVRQPSAEKAKPPPLTHIHVPLTDASDKNAGEAFVCRPVGRDGKRGPTYVVKTTETSKEKVARLKAKLAKETNKEKQEKYRKRIERAEKAPANSRMSHTLRNFTVAPYESKFEPGTPEWKEELEKSVRDEQSVAGSTRRSGSTHEPLPEEPEHRAAAGSSSGRSATGHPAHHAAAAAAAGSSSGRSATGHSAHVHHARVEDGSEEHVEHYAEHRGSESLHEPVQYEAHEQDSDQKLRHHSNSVISSSAHRHQALVVRRPRRRPDIDSDDSDSEEEGSAAVLTTASGSTLVFRI